MRLRVRISGISLVVFCSLLMVAGGGCQGEPNEEGIKDSETIVPPDAPKSMEDLYNQQTGKGSQPGT